MRKSIWLLTMVIVLALTFNSAAEAGSKSHYRWQGIAIGAGSLLFLDALLSPRYAAPAYYSPPAYYPPPVYYYPPPVYFNFGYYDYGHSDGRRHGQDYRHGGYYRGGHADYNRHGYRDGHPRGHGYRR